MTEAIESRPLKRKIPPDLQREVEKIQSKVPRIIDPVDDLDDSKKRWLVVGICLHTIISPVLRNYIVPIITKLCYTLVRLYNIEKQTYRHYLKTYGPTKIELNYEAINSNKANHKRKIALYDYRVRSAVDLSRLFLQTHMAHFTAFDDSCDSSALLGIIINIDRFPAVVQFDAQMNGVQDMFRFKRDQEIGISVKESKVEKARKIFTVTVEIFFTIRSDIRNSWAHCDFTEWTSTKYVNSFQLMRKLISNLRLSIIDENRIMGEINRWELNGQNFLSLTKLGLEIVGEIRQQTIILSKYVHTLCTEADSQFTIVKTELTGLESGLQEMTERIENLESRTRDHEVKLRNLEMQKQVEDPIPKNIREQIKGQLEDWEKKDKMFVSTRASDYVIESVQGNTCVTLTAPAGVGKSFICRHTALFLQKKGYNIIPVYAPTDIRDYYQPGKQTVFIVDDICGNYTANQQQIDNWKQLLPVINTIVADKCCKIIVSCRLQIYKDDKFKILTPFKSCECNLVSDELCLTSDEKTNIAKTYIGTNVKDINDLSQDCEFFPLLCSLYLETKNADMKEFFKNPFVVYRRELDRLNEYGDEGNYKLCSLALCVLFNNDLKENWFQGKLTVEQRHVIEDICEVFGINRSTSKKKLKKALETLDGTFICKTNGIYRTVHDKLFDFLAHYFGQQMIESLIDHIDSDLLHERFKWQTLSDDINSNIEFIIEIPDDYLESYLQRLIKDWSAGKVSDVFDNNNMKESSFRQQLLQYLLQLDVSQQITLASTKDTVRPKEEYGSGNTPLIDTCYEGYHDMVEWLLHNDVGVDQCKDDGGTGLIMASAKGHTEIVKLLLEKNPNVDLCDNDGWSPLKSASDEGHTDIVKLLLEKNPNVDLCNNDGWSPLNSAIDEGHTEIVKLLLEKNPNVDLCNNDGWSPLNSASTKGHTDIVKLLLEKNPNVDLCDNDGWSPLNSASAKGYTEIVKLLLEKNPNVDLCNNDGFTPLISSCTNYHTSIVRLLIKHEANINAQTFDGGNALYFCALVGSIEITQILLENNADCNICINSKKAIRDIFTIQPGYTLDKGKQLLFDSLVNNTSSRVTEYVSKKSVEYAFDVVAGCSPLHIACFMGRKDVVLCLLDHNANINMTKEDGTTPLCYACEVGHEDIVCLLLDNGADTQILRLGGKSPLQIATDNGQTSIVMMLTNLTNKEEQNFS
ncbi:uncharacterized protein [Mytilus edulis]|uniref:uncharacterized protein n=1 Tax=Mytilus edulis TaxID=6550 RepID=UPI0039EFC144